jgi:hypothetical protein
MGSSCEVVPQRLATVDGVVRVGRFIGEGMSTVAVIVTEDDTATVRTIAYFQCYESSATTIGRDDARALVTKFDAAFSTASPVFPSARSDDQLCVLTRYEGASAEVRTRHLGSGDDAVVAACRSLLPFVRGNVEPQRRGCFTAYQSFPRFASKCIAPKRRSTLVVADMRCRVA